MSEPLAGHGDAGLDGPGPPGGDRLHDHGGREDLVVGFLGVFNTVKLTLSCF